MSEQFYDLSFEQLADGTIRLDQNYDESCAIFLRPAQLRHIADAFLADLGITGQTHSIPVEAGCDEMSSLDVVRDDDGTIYLTQTRLECMGGSDDTIELHPVQASWLGARLLTLTSNRKSPAIPVTLPPAHQRADYKPSPAALACLKRHMEANPAISISAAIDALVTGNGDAFETDARLAASTI